MCVLCAKCSTNAPYAFSYGVQFSSFNKCSSAAHARSWVEKKKKKKSKSLVFFPLGNKEHLRISDFFFLIKRHIIRTMLQKRYFEDHVKNWIKVGDVWQIKREGEEMEKKSQINLAVWQSPQRLITNCRASQKYYCKRQFRFSVH